MAILSSTRRGRMFKFHSPDAGKIFVVSLQGEEALSEPYRWELELVSRRPDLDLLPAPASLGIKQPVAHRDGRGVRTIVVHGVLESFTRCERGRDLFGYRAVLVPRMTRLRLQRRCRAFRDRTVPEIVEQILRETELDFEFRLHREYARREYVAQFQESDFDFVSRLLEREGICYFFEQGDERETIVLGDSTVTHPLAGSVPVRAATANPLHDEEAWEFHVERRQVPREVVLEDYNYRTPRVDLRATSPVAAGFGTTYEFGTHHRTPEEGRIAAALRAEERRCRETTGLGRGNSRAVRPGARLAIDGEEWLIARVRHRGSQSIAAEGAPGEHAKYENEFACHPADREFRPERRTPAPRVPLLPGRIEVEELDDQGRYQVRLPWGDVTHFIRLAEPYAGAGYGVHFPLRRGTEVVLAHENGDPDRPFIAAAMPNPDTRSPVVNENRTQCVVRSAGNNFLLFDDQPGRELVYLHAQKLLDVRVEGTTRDWMGGSRHLWVKGDEFARVEGDAHLRVDGSSRIEVVNDAHRMIRGSFQAEVNGASTVASVGAVHLVGGAEIVVSATSALTLQCGASSLVLTPAGVSIHGPVIAMDLPPVFLGGQPPLPAQMPAPEAPAPPQEPGLEEIEPAEEEPEEAGGEEPSEEPRDFVYLIDEATDPSDHDDEWELASEDGAYRRRAPRSAAEPHGSGRLALRFPGVLPGRRYAFRHFPTPEDGIPVFDGVPFARLDAAYPSMPAPAYPVTPVEADLEELEEPEE